MKFIILDAHKDKVIVPNKVLPSTFRLLLSDDVQQLVTEDLEIRRLAEHPDYPKWQFCLVRTLSTQPSLSLSNHLGEQEISLSFKSQAALEPELDFYITDQETDSIIGPDLNTDQISHSTSHTHAEDAESHSPLTALDQLAPLQATAPETATPDLLEPSLLEPISLESNSVTPSLVTSLKALLKAQVEMTESLLGQYQAKLSQDQREKPIPQWNTHQLLGSLLLDQDYPKVIEESTNWALSVRSKILEQLKMWSSLSTEQKEQVQALMEHMKVQNIDIAQPPAWLLMRESCAEQAKNYQNFIAIYEEIDPK